MPDANPSKKGCVTGMARGDDAKTYLALSALSADATGNRVERSIRGFESHFQIHKS